MFRHILIPLDGSDLAESALPAACYFAATLGSKVTLVHVIEQDAPPTVHGERHLTSPAGAEAYLNELRQLSAWPATAIECHVHSGATANLAQSIVEHQGELSPDLIILCTHGHGGLRRILLGSIAQQVVAAGSTPVLLIRPDGKGRRGTFAVKTLLAPLDGKPVHEQGLEVACALAVATGARLQLLSVVPTIRTLAGQNAAMGKFMPGTTQAILDLAEEDLRAYLSKQLSRLEKTGVQAAAELRYGDAAPAIAAAAEALDAGIIVLGTHGRAGNEAFWTNSVGAKVQGQTRRPLLLIPVR